MITKSPGSLERVRWRSMPLTGNGSDPIGICGANRVATTLDLDQPLKLSSLPRLVDAGLWTTCGYVTQQCESWAE